MQSAPPPKTEVLRRSAEALIKAQISAKTEVEMMERKAMLIEKEKEAQLLQMTSLMEEKAKMEAQVFEQSKQISKQYTPPPITDSSQCGRRINFDIVAIQTLNK
eukprot:m51a1_g6720 hypothetical protein (104) ;mRNA; f:158243-158666